MKIRRFEEADARALDRLNERLHVAGAHERVDPEGSEQQHSAVIRQRLFVASDPPEIRGGVWLKEQAFRIRGNDVRCGWLKYPVAESLTDGRFSSVAGSLIFQCIREQPLLMALGLGGHSTALARMLAGLRWSGLTVPTLVRISRPSRALRELAPFRKTATRRAVANAASRSGIAFLALRSWDLHWRVRYGRTCSAYRAEVCDAFGAWTDQIWQSARDEYGFTAARDSASIEAEIAGAPELDVQRVRVSASGSDVGWAYVLRRDFALSPDHRFGRLVVGQVGDCFGAPRHAAGIVASVVDLLESQGVDVVFTNQLHPAWIEAFRRRGFLARSDRFAFYRAPRTNGLSVDWARECHLTRGDCHGPIW